ncbi:MAG: CU044_2847 family protein [Gemmatimonadales bacterium]
MAKQVQLTTKGGANIAIEVAEPAEASTARAFGDATGKVTKSFDEALSGIGGIADSLQAMIADAVKPPDSVTVTFGINFSVTAGLVITSGSGGANLSITMTWNRV